MAAAQVEVAGEAEHQEEILQEAAKVQEKQEQEASQQETGLKTEQVEAAKVQQEQEESQQETGLKTEQVEASKVQQEQEATSDNIQEEAGEACEEDHTDEKLKS